MSVASRFICSNPQCTNRRKSFASEKGFTLHIQRSPECLVYFRQSRILPLSWQQLKHPVALMPVYTSAKRTALLRRNVNNELLHNVQSVAFNAATSVEHAELTNIAGNVPCNDIEFPINDFDNDVHLSE